DERGGLPAVLRHEAAELGPGALLLQPIEAVGPGEPRVAGDEPDHGHQPEIDPPAARVAGQGGMLEHVRTPEQHGPARATEDRDAAEVVARASEPAQPRTRQAVDEPAAESRTGSRAEREGELAQRSASGEELRQR